MKKEENKVIDQATDKTVDKVIEKSPDKAIEKSTDKVVDKPIDKTIENIELLKLKETIAKQNVAIEKLTESYNSIIENIDKKQKKDEYVTFNGKTFKKDW